MLVFKSVTEMEFSDGESLEAFVRTLPLPQTAVIDLLDSRTPIVDTNDQSDATGVRSLKHTFTIEGEEE